MRITDQIDYNTLPHRDCFVRPPLEGNPYYPLPPDWPEIEAASLDTTRPDHAACDRIAAWWRVNACCIQETPEDFLIAVTFFTKTYLWPHESLFFENRRESPRMHAQMIYDIAAFPLNAFAAPRSSCKTTMLRIIVMVMMLTRRRYRIGGVFSIQAKAHDFVSPIKFQFKNNALLKHDFGDVEPKRGALRWSNERLEMDIPWGNIFWTMWLDGASRGGRFDWLFVDDGERDPDNDETIAQNTSTLQFLLQKKFLPMIEIAAGDLDTRHIGGRGRGICITGTIIDQRMLLCRIADDDDPTSPWAYWNRWRWEQEKDGLSLWEERWTAEARDLMKGVMGARAYASEMLNRPGALELGYLGISNKFHTYAIQRWRELPADPYAAENIVVWATRRSPSDGEDAVPLFRKMKLCDLLSNMQIAMTVDVAKTDSVHRNNDYTAFHILGCDANFVVWSLELSCDRYDTNAAMREFVRLVIKWKPRRVVGEKAGIYQRVADEIFQASKLQILDAIGFLPSVHFEPVNERRESKGARIDRAIHWRAQFDMLRFPLHLSTEHPYSMLWDQFRKFTVSLEGLSYDDCLDTLSFIPYTFKGPGGTPFHQPSEHYGENLISLIEQGRLYLPDGTYLPSLVPNESYMTEAAYAAIARDQKRVRSNRVVAREPRRILAIR